MLRPENRERKEKMEEKKVQISVENHIMTIKLNNPEDKNRCDRFMYIDIANAVDEAENNDDVRVIIFTGDRNNFSTGGRIDATGSDDEKRLYIESLGVYGDAWNRLTKPLIAAIEGDCLAGGFSDASRADIAVARKGVKFGLPEIRRGGFPCMVQIPIIDVIPKKKMLPMLYTGELFEAEEAEKCGLITCVADDEEFWPTVMRYAETIASMPQDLIQVGRETYYGFKSRKESERTEYGQQQLAKILELQSKYQREV